MSIDTPPIPPEGEPKQKNFWLWGCLIALILALGVFCCGGTLFFIPFFSERDAQDTGSWDWIEEYLPLEYLEDPSSIPGFEEFFENLEDSVSGSGSEDITIAEDIPLAFFNFVDIGTSLYYPAGWDIEVEGYGVTFYDPESYTYIFLGEDITEPGTRAEEIAMEIMESIQEEAQEDSFQLISSITYSVSIAEDAHLNFFEWVDQEGYYNWAYDLEMVSGESNIYLFLSGENPDEIALYGDLLDILASSLEMLPDLEESEDA